jgi:uncharacterized protein (UPF0332 family)
MDGRRLLTLAEKLLEGVAARSPLTGGDGAPECRTAISRAYYAAFLVAAAYLDRIGFAVESSPAAHVAVQYALNNSGDATLRNVSSDLGKLHAKRRVADYEPKNAHPEQLPNAQEAVRLAADVIAWLDDVRDNSTPERMGAIAVAISKWLKSAQTAGLRQKSGTG